MKKITLLLTLLAFTFSFAQTLEGTWKLTPQAGALAVGPTQGSAGWWQNSAGDVTTRACLFDDQYVFNSDGSFNNVLGTDTWLETWQGVGADGCGTPVAPHDGSASATWTYDSTANTITLTGTGAFLGLAKVFNGGELNGSNSPPASITYTVTSISSTNMTIDIAISGGWWRFLYTKEVAGLNDNVFNAVKMFPNPAKDVVQFLKHSNEPLDIQIFDMLGKSLIVHKNVQSEFNISSLRTGVYFVQMTLRTKATTKKLVVH